VTTTAAKSEGRRTWIDAGRGIAIVLVTLYHAVNWSHGAGFDVDIWTRVNATLSSLRMPLFFTISGVLGYPWLTREWRSLVDRKILLFLWVFVGWEAISSAVFFLVMTMNGNGHRTSVLHLGLQFALTPFFPRFELWFIWVLGIFFVLSKATRRVWWQLQLLVAGAASIFAFSQMSAPNTGYLGIGKYYVFFIAGMYLRAHILSVERRVTLRVAVPVFVTWAVFAFVLNTGVLTSTTRPVAVAGSLPGGLFLFAYSVVGLATGVTISHYVASWRTLRHLGANTLPIYVCHTPLIMLCTYALYSLGIPAGAPLWVSVILPPVLSVLAIVACLQVKALSDRVAPWLFAAPLWLRQLVMRLWPSKHGAAASSA
jgi:uncharacterized membrane protein YcfT